jgi:hypothetical protein
MDFEINFTPEAEETYDAVIDQLRQRWGEHFVTKFENRVSSSLNTISKNPYTYPITDQHTELRKCILHKNCSLLYKVFDRVVLVVCFWDNRQDPLIAF